MLRRARWLILLAILAIAGSITSLFLSQRKALRRARPRISAPLPSNTSALAQGYRWDLMSGDHAKIVINAKTFRAIKEPSVLQLEGLDMEIHAIGKPLVHRITSASARMDQDTGELYADNEVLIELNHSDSPDVPDGRILKIRTTAATLDVRSSRVSTKQKAFFEFDQGSGDCIGAVYDPSTRSLTMESEVHIDYHSKDPQKPPMHLEAGHLTYREGSSLVHLESTAKLSRGPFSLDSDSAVVFLQKGALDRVEAQKARGQDLLPDRKLDYAADYLNLFFAPKGEIRKVEASRNARLLSSSNSGQMESTAERFDLDFLTSQDEAQAKAPAARGKKKTQKQKDEDGSTLQRVLATGHARVESRAAARAGATPPGPRILTSEVIELQMRPGGKEIDKVITHAPGQAEFLPARKGDRKRTLNGDRLTLEYGPANSIRSCRAVGVTTRTEGVGKDGKPTLATTRSKDLQADFDPQSGQLTRLEQWTNFEYDETPRRATAERAVFDPQRELVTLSPKARIWDDAGSTAADEIVLEQQSGDLRAQGNVASTRVSKPKSAPADAANPNILSSSEPVQARAQRMTSTERGTKIRYEGDAVLWQTNRRLQAQNIFIDQTLKSLEATGNVVSEFPDQGSAQKPKDGKAGKSPRKANAFTTVKAPSLVYSDSIGVAHYSGGATLDRTGMNVKASQIHAYFAKEPKAGGGEENRLDHAFADGKVELVEATAGRAPRTGSSEHAEYYLSDERVVLTGGNPVVVDPKRGTTRGALITWYSREDRLMVDNTGAGPAVSHIDQKEMKKKEPKK